VEEAFPLRVVLQDQVEDRQEDQAEALPQVQVVVHRQAVIASNY
jgi:hypothetical protein